jgi:hypothetical protein
MQIVQFGAGAPCRGDGDGVFKALADPTRRALLDRFRERSGQTLGSNASRLRWRGSQRPSIWACRRPRTSSPPSARTGRSCTTSTRPATGHPGTLDRQIRTTPPARAQRHLHGTGRRTGEVVLVVFKGVRSACDILCRTMVQSAAGVTHSTGTREAYRHICPGQPVADQVGGTRHRACRSILKGDRIFVA